MIDKVDYYENVVFVNMKITYSSIFLEINLGRTKNVKTIHYTVLK